MTNEEFTIRILASLIKDKQDWENFCGGCKHLGNSMWHFEGKKGCSHYCSHPDRQDGFHNPRPYGCNGLCYEK